MSHPTNTFGMPHRLDPPRRNWGTPVPRTDRVRKPQIRLEPVTGPLTSVHGRRVLVLVDVENLCLGARDVGCRLSFAALARTLRQAAATCSIHGFFSREPGDRRLENALTRAGWSAHPRDVARIGSARGTRSLANSDYLIAFYGGLLATRRRLDAVVLASGDGPLVLDLARALAGLPTPREIVTLSLPGSTSWALDARTNRHITTNIEIGRDCLNPFVRRTLAVTRLPA
jgi:hypothetical protein